MRIAFVSSDPGVPVFGTKGASVHAQGMLGALLRTGADVEVFTARAGGDPPPCLWAVAVHEHGRPAAGDPEARERALAAANRAVSAHVVRAGPFDLVYERQALFGWAGMAAARATGTPGVLEVNAPLVEEQIAHRILIDRDGAEAGLRRSFGSARAVVAVSTTLGRRLERRPEARGKVHVIPNGVDPGRFPSPGPRAGGRPFTVGFVGTLKPWHGLDTLADAFALLRESLPGARLLVIGDGPGRRELEERLDRAGVREAAVLTGVVAPGEVGALLARVDATVAPYPAGGDQYFSPLKVFEGMAAGAPVVGSRVGQLAELVEDGRTGVLCPPGDARAFADALLALAVDPERSDRIGAAARAWVLRHHTWDGVARRVLALAVPSAGHAT